MKVKTKKTVPAETWEYLASAISSQQAAEHKGPGPLKVRTVRHEGFLWTGFSAMYGPLGRDRTPYVEVWRLIPEQLYSGVVMTVYHDEEAIQRGERERGDRTGLLVLANGARMVCADRVYIEIGLPTTRPISLEEAISFDEKQRRWGWRVLAYKGAVIDWFFLEGHPVARYVSENCCHAVLFWRGGRDIKELSIDFDDFKFQFEPAGGKAEVIASNIEAREPCQLELF